MTPYGIISIDRSEGPVAPPPPPPPGSTAISQLAATLSAGEWATLNDNSEGYTRTLLHSNSGAGTPLQSITEFSNKACYDPFHGEVHFIGQSHPNRGIGKHVRYTLSTNSWDVIRELVDSDTSGLITWSDETIDHAYHHNTIVERSNGDIEPWYRGFNASGVTIRWNRGTTTYSGIPQQPPSSTGENFFAIEFFPERNSVIMNHGVNDGIWEFDLVTETWSRIDFFSGGPQAGCIGLYSPVNGGVMYLGGGSTAGTSNYWLTSSSNVPVQLASCPVGYDSHSSAISLPFVDPVTGCLCVLKEVASQSIQFYEYDPRRDSAAGMGGTGNGWHRLDGNTPGDTRDYESILSTHWDRVTEGDNPFFQYLIWAPAAPIWDIGVTLFMQSPISADPKTVIYKHASLP